MTKKSKPNKNDIIPPLTLDGGKSPEIVISNSSGKAVVPKGYEYVEKALKEKFPELFEGKDKQ